MLGSTTVTVTMNQARVDFIAHQVAYEDHFEIAIYYYNKSQPGSCFILYHSGLI